MFAPYPLKALVGPDPEAALAQEVAAATPDPAMIDYYGQLLPESGQHVAVGDTVIFGFRAQAFFTRAPIRAHRRRRKRHARGQGRLDKRRPPRRLA